MATQSGANTKNYWLYNYRISIHFFALFFNPSLRALYLIVGLSLHSGILLMLNIYPFGLGMLIFYTLLIPFSWWRKLALFARPKTPHLTVFYDKECPLCNRTVLTINHFDIFKSIDFKDLQTFSKSNPALKNFSLSTLLKDLYAVDRNNRIFNGIDTYIQILIHIRYLALLGWFLKTPGIYHLARAKYRSIADNRSRTPPCTSQCLPSNLNSPTHGLYTKIFDVPDKIIQSKNITKLTKVTIFILFLQLNSTIHYGLIYRLQNDTSKNPYIQTLAQASNTLLMLSQTFIGITPHALYLHDHFSGYNKLFALKYTTESKSEYWLPFINSEGRILAPNWGRIHSMWANIAVTPKIDESRLAKAIMKTTAFWGKKLKLDLDNTQFSILIRNNSAPTQWMHDQLRINLNQPWQKAGSATWSNNKFSMNLPKSLFR